MIVLSYIEARHMLEALSQDQKQIEVSMNLGKTKSVLQAEGKAIRLSDGQLLKISDVEKISENESVCFLIREKRPIKIQLFSEKTNKLYKLLPTGEWPTIEISGVRMHRVQEVKPGRDSRMKISAVSPIRGRVLDTCTGLGYTALLASKEADEVITHEWDSGVIEIARHNPWSEELFSSKKIKRVEGNIFEIIKNYPDNSFARIIHDPPRVTLSGDLYSLEFYRQLYRVLEKRGKLFHYTGDPGKRTRGYDIAGGVMQRLKQAGFVHVKRKRFVLGVVALKKYRK